MNSFPPDGVGNAVYADAIKATLASQVTITSQWEPVTVRGMAGLRAIGKAATVDDAVVEVTVVVIGRNAWRTLVVTRGRSPDQDAAKENFVHAMFGTVN